MQKTYKDEVSQLIENLKGALDPEKYAIFENDAKELEQTHKQPLMVKKGDKAPEFSLPDINGDSKSLSSLLANGPVVLTFYRGNWCPYCSLLLSMYEELYPEFSSHKATIVAISPQDITNSKDMHDKHTPHIEILSDVGNNVAKQYTTVYRYSDEAQKAMKELGYDFASFYADDSGEMPVPAVFVIDTNGSVAFAASEGGDFRERTEPNAVLEEIKKLTTRN